MFVLLLEGLAIAEGEDNGGALLGAEGVVLREGKFDMLKRHRRMSTRSNYLPCSPGTAPTHIPGRLLHLPLLIRVHRVIMNSPPSRQIALLWNKRVRPSYLLVLRVAWTEDGSQQLLVRDL